MSKEKEKKNVYPKFEKVDDHTVRIIQEVSEDVPLHVIIDNYKSLKNKQAEIKLQQAQMDLTEKNMEIIFEFAKKQDIKVEPPKPPAPPKGK